MMADRSDRDGEKQNVAHVVILIHGIRTNALWQSALRAELEKHGVKVELTNYGYFDIFRFLMPIPQFRQKTANRVHTLIRDIKTLYPNAKTSFLAHSFGTYIITSIIRREFDINAHRIVFCGSVVRYNFPFHDFSSRFTPPILNEVGSRDFLPALAESITWGYGSAGTYGFRVPRVRDRWHNNFNHSAFLTPEFCRKYWVPFFLDGSIVEGDAEFSKPAFFARLISWLRIKYLMLCLIMFMTLQSSAGPIIYKPSAWLDSIYRLSMRSSDGINIEGGIEAAASLPQSVFYFDKPGCKLSFVRIPIPYAADREQVRVLNNWVEENIVEVYLPQLTKISIGPRNGMVRFNKRGAEALKAAWAEVEQSGLLNRVISWEGSFVSRLNRGSDTELNIHTCGFSFDINAEQNPFRMKPAPIGRYGSVLELVPIFEKHGFKWGGKDTQRLDPMHFEYEVVENTKP